jgi:hypothetical protein
MTISLSRIHRHEIELLLYTGRQWGGFLQYTPRKHTEFPTYVVKFQNYTWLTST